MADDLYEQVMELTEPRETKADCIEYYQWKYKATGGDSWRRHIISDLSDITGLSPRSLARRFNPSRINDIEPRNAEQYRELGENIAPKPPPGGFHITGIVWVKFSDGQCEERTVDEYITEENAVGLVDAASDAIEQAVVNHYMTRERGQPTIDIKEPIAVASGDCEPPELIVEALEEE